MMMNYSTTKIVLIPSKILTIIYYSILVGILGYIAVYGMWYSKRYQTACPVQSVVTTKVMGTLSTRDVTSDRLRISHHKAKYYQRVWDAQDIVTPAHGGDNDGIFVMTNILRTPNQTQKNCPENPEFARCTRDLDCKKGASVKLGNGIMTGKCVPSGDVLKSCEIYAWCPVEDFLHIPKLEVAGKEQALLVGTQDFTIRIKNFIEFPAFGHEYWKRNIEDTMTTDYLQNCVQDPERDPYCPVFKLGDIVRRAGHSYEDVAWAGGVFSVGIKWDCDFDWGNGIEDCKPKYSFQRIDNAMAKVSRGWHFRSVSYHEENRRSLTHQWGIKILVEVEGEGRKFDSVKFLLTVGAGLTYFAVASFACDNLLKLFCKLKECFNSSWLASYDEEMKYDLQFVKKREVEDKKRGGQIDELKPFT